MRKIIILITKLITFILGYAFRNYTYIIFAAIIGVLAFKNYINSNYPISIINRKVLLSIYPDILIK